MLVCNVTRVSVCEFIRVSMLKLKAGYVSRGVSTAKLTARLGLGAARRVSSVQPAETERAVKIAEDLVKEFDSMKGLMMKFGQMASYLGTHMPPEAQAVLAQLQASSSTMPFEQARSVIEQELGNPLEVLFDSFEEEAFAAASIGQVHRATLNGKAVAVKVQYPNIENLIEKDVSIAGKLFIGLMAGTKMPGKGMVEELKERLLEECDYRLEIANQLAIRELCESQPDQYVPSVCLLYTSPSPRDS